MSLNLAKAKGLESPRLVRHSPTGRAQTLPGKTNTSPVCHNSPQKTKEMTPPKLSLGPSESMELQEHW